MATHSRTLAWRIPWTEERGEPQSMGAQRIGNVTDLIWRLPLLLTIPLASYSLSHSLSFLIYILGIKVFTSWDPEKHQTRGR